MSNDFLPADYEAPKSENNYLKFEQGDTKFRILASPVLGFEGWSNEDKPVRFEKMPDEAQLAILRAPKYGTKKVKHFWAMPVYCYKESKLMVLQLTQVTIIEGLTKLAKSEEWGSPLNYDVTINKTGEKTDTTYTIIPVPPKTFEGFTAEELIAELSGVDLQKLFTGEDVFS